MNCNEIKIALRAIVIFILYANKIYGQTYVSPVIGIDLHKVISDPNNALEMKHTGFGYASPTIGIQLKQTIFQSLFFQYSFDFTHKHLRAFDNGGVRRDLIYHYDYFRNQLMIMYLINKKLFFGGGLSLNIINDFYREVVESPPRIGPKTNDIFETGIVFILGYKYHNFNIESYYFARNNGKALKIDNFDYIKLYQIYTLGIRLSYDIKIWSSSKNNE